MIQNLKTAVLWDVTSCSLVEVYWRFRASRCPHLRLWYRCFSWSWCLQYLHRILCE